jgi:hypothetical protein
MKTKKNTTNCYFFKPIGSTSNSTTENTNQSEDVEITTQPAAHNDSVPDPVNAQTSDQNTELVVIILEQARAGSTAYERDPAKRQQIW